MNQSGNNNINQNPNKNPSGNKTIPNNIPEQQTTNSQMSVNSPQIPIVVPEITPHPQQPSTNIQVQSPPQVAPQIVKPVEKTEEKVQISQATKVDINNTKQLSKKTGNVRTALLIMFFISLLALVWFLPDIRKYVTDKKMENQEELIHGTLKCVYEEEDELVTTLYTSEFIVDNNRLKSYTSTVETKGDISSEVELTKLDNDCKSLSKMIKQVPGVTSACSLNSRKQISKQTIDYSKVQTQKLKSAYSEAGGIMPDYKLDQDARGIKKEMILARYSCTVN